MKRWTGEFCEREYNTPRRGAGPRIRVPTCVGGDESSKFERQSQLLAER